MGRLVGVSDPLPAFRSGLVAELLAAGFAADQPEDLVAWCVAATDRLAILTVVGLPQWATLDRIRLADQTTPVVALLDDPSHDCYRRALRSGATAALARSSTPARIVSVARAAYDEQSLLPAAVAAQLAADRSPTIVLLDADETRWLRRLADGVTVDDLAWQEGYSTRTMYRRLRSIYRRLGALDRTRALVRAVELGLLADA